MWEILLSGFTRKPSIYAGCGGFAGPTTSFDAHMNVIDFVALRKTDEALKVLTDHIDMSLQRAIEITKEMVARFFLVEASAPLQAAGRSSNALTITA